MCIPHWTLEALHSRCKGCGTDFFTTHNITALGSREGEHKAKETEPLWGEAGSWELGCYLPCCVLLADAGVRLGVPGGVVGLEDHRVLCVQERSTATVVWVFREKDKKKKRQHTHLLFLFCVSGQLALFSLFPELWEVFVIISWL